MAEPGIVFDHVWKKFRRGELHDSLRDLLPMLTGRFRGTRPSPQELGRREFWALSDVSFEVRPGEALGIIGANGAGKSTFLKILAGESEADSGTVTVGPRERIAVLKQDQFAFDEYTVFNTVIMGHARLYEVMAAREAMSRARHSIHLLNWAFDPDTLFDPEPGGGGPNSERFGAFPGGFWGVHGIHVDGEGNFYVAEVDTGRVQKYRPRAGARKEFLIGAPFSAAR